MVTYEGFFHRIHLISSNYNSVAGSGSANAQSLGSAAQLAV